MQKSPSSSTSRTQNPDVACKVALALESAYSTIAQHPQWFSKFNNGTRRAILPDFPYSVLFREYPEYIQILAVAHAKRSPSQWKNRT